MKNLLLAVAALALIAAHAPAQNVSSSALINHALDQPVTLELNSVLPDAMNAIGNQTGVRIEADPAVWELLPWGQQTNLRAKIANQSLRQALDLVTRKLGLTYVLKEEAVELQPMPALRRLARRATEQELAALDLLSSTPAELKTDRPTLRELVDAVDARLVELKAPFAIEYRPDDSIRPERPINVPRNATLAEALEMLPRQSNATWYPWGKSIVIVPKEDRVRAALARTINVRYNGVDVAQVLMELFARAGVDYEIEPGALQRIPPEFRTIRLLLTNASIREALESIAGVTGLQFTVTDRGMYIANPSRTAATPRDPIIGLITIPDLGIQLLVPRSQVPPDLQQYLQHKTSKELEKLRQLMQEEGFKPTPPTTKPADERQDL